MTGPRLIGLTGSIGMGKSTTAGMFAEAGLPVWDADAAVHRLYAAGGPAGPMLAPLCPDAVGPDGAVDRDVLKAWIARDPQALQRIEAVVHPLVVADRAAFIARAEQAGAPAVVLDIPLLFETGADAGMDRVVVVSAPPDIQRERVLSRPGMNAAQFETILARQLPDADKRARADDVIETLTLEGARAAVARIVAQERERAAHA